MEMTITVESKAIGQKGPASSVWEVQIIESAKPLLLRDLITSIVRGEVDACNRKNHPFRLSSVLSLQDIEEGQAAGKVSFGFSSRIPIINPEEAIDKALKGFIGGHYYVFVNDLQIENLQDEVNIEKNSKVVFIKLTPLIGG